MRIGVRGWWEGGRTYAPVVCSRDVSYVHGFIFLLDSQAIYLKLSAVPSRGAKRPQILLRASRSSQHSRGFMLFSKNLTCFPRALRSAKQERQATANTVPSWEQCLRSLGATYAGETRAGAKLPARSRPGKKYDVRCHPLTPIYIYHSFAKGPLK